MSESQAPANRGQADFDLSQFYAIFFEEAGENLDTMEQMLLHLDLAQADDEELNGIFRCAHSVKGGAATFGFSDVAELTHQMEFLLDRLRRHEVTPLPAMVDVLLESADVSRVLLARHQHGDEGEPVSTEALVQRIRELADQSALKQPQAPIQPAQVASDSIAEESMAVAFALPDLAHGERCLRILVGPLNDLTQADAVKELFRDIPGLGKIDDAPSDAPDQRIFLVVTESSDEELLELFTFHVAKEQVQIIDLSQKTAEPAPDESAALDASVMEVSLPAAAAEIRETVVPVAPKTAVAPSAAASLETATIRVSVSKVDQLINLVGELVITQAMLAQNSASLDPRLHPLLMAGLADLSRNSRDLQESVMSIRMMPMSTVFNRFPRMLRDLAHRLEKQVELVTVGDATELDKGLVEKITDPLTHLVRNSCDHGIEMPEERLALGKPAHGTITLVASHQGGSIVIEVRDDGRGLSREKLLRKARERGMDVSDQMSDSDVWQLIFAPGFSTNENVTDVSGRGVGMDVVKRNIASLNGTVDIESRLGKGMRVSVRLPLTLAIMDGMSIGVGDDVYIVPLSSVIESFQVSDSIINTVAQGAQVVKVRDEYLPVVALEKIFDVPRSNTYDSPPIMVVIEADGSRVALLVDALVGQQQVVVKNLESNYRKVPNISGATILGDGRVALILDTAGLVRRARH